MPNPYFAFKQFTVFHDRCAMKVGTDAVLLGAWVNLVNAGRILDVGTGSGIIAIMCAQRSAAIIDAVEIDRKAYEQAVENVKACPWRERLSIHHCSFQNFPAMVEDRFDVIVSNPPYFSNSLKPPQQERLYARHDEKLGYISLLHYSKPLLSESGRLAVIIPAKDADHFTSQAYLNDLYRVRQTMISAHNGSEPMRCLLEFSGDKDSVGAINAISIRKAGNSGYTDDYKILTGDFYLKMD